MVKVKKDLTGLKFGHWTVIEQTEDKIKPNGEHVATWLCECDCLEKTQRNVTGESLRAGTSSSCGCERIKRIKSKPRVRKNLIGNVYGRLTVIGYDENSNDEYPKWICMCSCGNRGSYYENNLIYGKTLSCGCFRLEQVRNKCLIDISGNKYGYLKVIGISDKFICYRGYKNYLWECMCDCGEHVYRTKEQLMYGHFLYCGNCNFSTHISYGEKFMIALLKQANVSYIREFSRADADWCNDYRYDFFLLNYNTIIEVHGEQHYKNSFKSIGNMSLEEVQLNDKRKKEKAIQNGIDNYIIIDCQKSNLEYLKTSILQNTQLAKYIDINKINFDKCHEFAISDEILLEVIRLWNEDETLTTTDIGKIVGLTQNTVSNYLKSASQIGICSYSAKEGKERGYRKTKKTKNKEDKV